MALLRRRSHGRHPSGADTIGDLPTTPALVRNAVLATQGDPRPDQLDHSERPILGEKSVDAGQRAAKGKNRTNRLPLLSMAYIAIMKETAQLRKP